jgi:hypothetical protein
MLAFRTEWATKLLAGSSILRDAEGCKSLIWDYFFTTSQAAT